jgi:hypothetical protein
MAWKKTHVEHAAVPGPHSHIDQFKDAKERPGAPTTKTTLPATSDARVVSGEGSSKPSDEELAPNLILDPRGTGECGACPGHRAEDQHQQPAQPRRWPQQQQQRDATQGNDMSTVAAKARLAATETADPVSGIARSGGEGSLARPGGLAAAPAAGTDPNPRMEAAPGPAGGAAVAAPTVLPSASEHSIPGAVLPVSGQPEAARGAEAVADAEMRAEEKAKHMKQLHPSGGPDDEEEEEAEAEKQKKEEDFQ